jgi:folate-dependent phosphoribosylglycinamide formyltransferase PurN
LLDVLAFRVYYRLFLAQKDAAWERQRLSDLQKTYPPLHPSVTFHETSTPNDLSVVALLRDIRPDFVIARCKSILKPEVFQVPSSGTFVLHPGICPQYRNAHGCFWALTRRDLTNVGASLLRVDRGVDTGPVFAYFYYDGDERLDSHVVIQHRVVFDNLGAIAAKLREVIAGRARPLGVDGRDSRMWGQPWLTSYIKWKLAARKRVATRGRL